MSCTAELIGRLSPERRVVKLPDIKCQLTGFGSSILIPYAEPFTRSLLRELRFARATLSTSRNRCGAKTIFRDRGPGRSCVAAGGLGTLTAAARSGEHDNPNGQLAGAPENCRPGGPGGKPAELRGKICRNRKGNTGETASPSGASRRASRQPLQRPPQQRIFFAGLAFLAYHENPGAENRGERNGHQEHHRPHGRHRRGRGVDG